LEKKYLGNNRNDAKPQIKGRFLLPKKNPAKNGHEKTL